MTKKLPPKRTPDEIAELARDLLGGRVYAIDEIPENLARTVFMPLLFGGLKGYTREQLSRLYVFAVRGKDRTAAVAVNGYPIFYSCQVWRREDAAEAQEKARRAQEMLDV